MFVYLLCCKICVLNVNLCVLEVVSNLTASLLSLDQLLTAQFPLTVKEQW